MRREQRRWQKGGYGTESVLLRDMGPPSDQRIWVMRIQRQPACRPDCHNVLRLRQHLVRKECQELFRLWETLREVLLVPWLQELVPWLQEPCVFPDERPLLSQQGWVMFGITWVIYKTGPVLALVVK